MENVIWPTDVENFANEIFENIKDLLNLEETSEKNIKSELCKLFLNKFLNNEELILTEKEFDNVYHYALIQTSLDKLYKLGLINQIENENDEPLYFLTQKGKEIRDLI
jgi:hypothetical protein